MSFNTPSNPLGTGQPPDAISPGTVAPKEMAATVPGASTIGISAEKKRGFQRVLGLVPEQNDQELYALFQADSLNRFYIPAVMQGQDNPPTPPHRTVHILGSDPRAQFLSHSLHSVYDSVKPINPFPTRYQNLSEKGRLRSNPAKGKKVVEEAEENEHISNLVVAGTPSQAVSLLKSVKHRVDKRTAVCYMQDGLGIVEDVNNIVFRDDESRPSTILGHMTHALAKDRRSQAIRVSKDDGESIFTSVRPLVAEETRKQTDAEKEAEKEAESRRHTEELLSGFAQARLLHARGTSLDNWLLHKIPSLMFASIADPLCVMLGYRYQQLIFNPSANRLMDQLLDEISEVVAHIPEVQRLGPHMQKLLRGEAMRKHIINQLRGKKGAPCEMLQQIERGQLTNINYLNGYFVRRAKRMGMSMPANEMLVDLVKSKHKAEQEKLRSYIPMEMTPERQI